MTARIEASEIAPSLWMGSRPPQGHALAAAGVRIVAFCADSYQPSSALYPDVSVVSVALRDRAGDLSPTDIVQASQCAWIVAKHVRQGKLALVTCEQGRNRSGLVTALALVHLTGMSGLEAALHVKMRRRTPCGEALTNETFIASLQTIPKLRRDPRKTCLYVHGCGIPMRPGERCTHCTG